MAKNILEFRDVHFSYRKSNGKEKILQGVSFSVPSNSVMSLLGPSGSGKTTILRLALGLEKPTSGQIFINGELVSDQHFVLPPEQRGLGLLFQDIALFPHLNAYDNIAFGIQRNRQLTALDKKSLVQNLLKKVGLEQLFDRYPHQLSGGEQQRVALARALAPGSKLILMDEPFSSLNERVRDELRDWLLHFLEENKIATLLVTHSAEEAMFMSDTMAILHDQKLQQQGHPLDLYYHPKSPFVASIFGEVNRFAGVVSQGKVVTPLGALSAETLTKNDEKKMVEVVIRADAIDLINCSMGEEIKKTTATKIASEITGEVVEVRFLGNHLLIHWQCHNDASTDNRSPNTPFHIHSRLLTDHANPRRFKVGDRVRAVIEKKGLFVFA